MHTLNELDRDRLTLARQCAGTLMTFKAYLPPGGLLLMLIGKFRDDVLDVLGLDRGPLPKRGTERHSLDELTSAELDTVAGSTGILLDQFTPYMDDPALPRLLRDYQADLNTQKAERAQIRTEIADARAS
jgi:hypothetical protein